MCWHWEVSKHDLALRFSHTHITFDILTGLRTQRLQRFLWNPALRQLIDWVGRENVDQGLALDWSIIASQICLASDFVFVLRHANWWVQVANVLTFDFFVDERCQWIDAVYLSRLRVIDFEHIVAHAKTCWACHIEQLRVRQVSTARDLICIVWVTTLQEHLTANICEHLAGVHIVM